MSEPEGAHRARKRFGQNFLVDPNIIRKIVAAIAPKPGEILIEIGPGLGALTAPLVEHAQHLHVVEIDRDLVARLRNAYAPEKMSIHEGDALKFNFAELGNGLRVVGNLPYNISTPLLFHLADQAAAIRDMTFMLQREVVDRMVAEPDTDAYGRLSVMLQYRFHLDKLFDVPPGAFRPMPKVTSAIVRLVPKPASELDARDETLLARIVAAAFGQRRKTLRNTLRDFLDQAQFAELGVDAGWRGERLAVEDFVRIANFCAGG